MSELRQDAIAGLDLTRPLGWEYGLKFFVIGPDHVWRVTPRLVREVPEESERLVVIEAAAEVTRFLDAVDGRRFQMGHRRWRESSVRGTIYIRLFRRCLAN